MIKNKRLKIAVLVVGLLSGLVMAALGWPGLKNEAVYSQTSCQFVPVGQFAEYVMDAHKELLLLFQAAEKEYVNILQWASRLFELVYMCQDPDEKCVVKKDMCPKLCEPEGCDQGQACEANNASDTDLCAVPLAPGSTVTVRDKIDEIIKLIDQSDKEIAAIATRAAIMAGELGLAKDRLASSKEALANADPLSQNVFDCNQAKNEAITPRCEPRQVDCAAPAPADVQYCVDRLARMLQVGGSLGFEPESSFDYFICPKLQTINNG